MKNEQSGKARNKKESKREIRNARRFKEQLDQAYDEMFPNGVLGGGSYR